MNLEHLEAELNAELSNQDDGLPVEVIVHGRRWRDQFNTYHSVMVEVDGEIIGVEPFAYGYGEQYQETAYDILKDKGVLPGLSYEWGAYTLKRACEELGVDLVTEVYDVKRKKDLHKGNEVL